MSDDLKELREAVAKLASIIQDLVACAAFNANMDDRRIWFKSAAECAAIATKLGGDDATG